MTKKIPKPDDWKSYTREERKMWRRANRNTFSEFMEKLLPDAEEVVLAAARDAVPGVEKFSGAVDTLLAKGRDALDAAIKLPQPFEAISDAVIGVIIEVVIEPLVEDAIQSAYDRLKGEGRI